jgi:sugar lactone lactonase YvrE
MKSLAEKRCIAVLFFCSWAQLNAQYVTSTFAGGGAPQGVSATSAGIGYPDTVTGDSAGNIYIASANQNRVYKVDTHGILTTVAGNGGYGFSGDGGPAVAAALSIPGGVAVDQSGSIYISDQYNNRVRKVSNSAITTVVGNGNTGPSGDGGPATSAAVSPGGIALDGAGNLYICDSGRIRKVSNGIISTVAGGGLTGSLGDGGPATAAIMTPTGIAVDAAGNLYIADYGNNRIRMVANGVITTVAGNGIKQFSGDGGPATSASLNAPVYVTVDHAGSVYFSEQLDGRVRSVSGGVINTVAGNGNTTYSGDNAPATSVGLNAGGVFVNGAGKLFIADYSSSRLRVVTNGVISTAAGNGTPGYTGDGDAATAATLAGPTGVAVDNAGNVYIADTGNYRIRKISDGKLTTAAFLTQCAIFNGCGYQVAVDKAGGVYFTDLNFIRKISNGVITVVAGNGSPVSSGDGGPATSAGIAPDDVLTVAGNGDLYFSEFRSKVRRVSNGIITTVAGSNNLALGDGGPALSASLLRINGLGSTAPAISSSLIAATVGFVK